MKDLKAHFALFFVNVLYGASHILAKGIMPTYISPNVFILFRVVGASILFWLLYISLGREKVDRKDFGLLALCGLFGVALNQLFFFHGLNLSSAFNSGIIMAMNPIMVGILAFFLLKEIPSMYRVLGILMGATGAILLTFQGATQYGDSALGDLFLVINALSYAVYLVIAKPLMSKYKPLTVITWVFSFGLLYVLAFPYTLIDLSSTQFEQISSEAWGKIAYVVVGVTFLTYLLSMYGLKYLSPTVSAAYIYFQPALVILFAFTFAAIEWADDYTGTITLEKIAYMLIVFAGVYLSSVKRKTKNVI